MKQATKLNQVMLLIKSLSKAEKRYIRLYTNLQNDGVDAVYTLLWMLLIVTLPLPMMCFALGRRAK